jgi:hypothetical protein
MPATIIGNNEWNQRGLVLTAQDAQEQVNGLVNVQATYVGPSSKHDIISRSFYQDAPPPIWPSVVNRSELVTDRLYMESRAVTRANGLTTVRASYVGGLQRAGFNGYFLSEFVEKNKKAKAYNYVETETLYSQSSTGTLGTVGFAVLANRVKSPTGSTRLASAPLQFTYNEKIKKIEFVRIGEASSARLPIFYRSDCAFIVRPGTPYTFGLSGVLSPTTADSANLWIVDAPEELASFEQNTPVPFSEDLSYITPTVKVVTLEYRLTRS